MKIVVIIPTYNERENIGPLIDAIEEEFAKIPHDCHILVVDDNSPDKTAQVVKEKMFQTSGVKLITGSKEGLGAAYIRGMKFATDKLKADAVMEMDADFSHKPSDVPRLIKELDEGYDFVIGSRHIKGGSIPADWPLLRKLNTKVANLVARYLAGLYQVKDCTAGFRAISTKLLRKIDLDNIRTKGYSFQIGILHEAISAGAKIKEVPVDFIDRKKGETKLGFNVKERVLFIWDSVLIRFEKSETFLKFATVGTIGVVVNLGSLFILAEKIGVIKEVASPIAIEFSIISNFLFNNFWTFSERKVKSLFLIKLIKFNIVSLLSLIVTYSTFLILTRVFGVYYLLAQSVGIVLAMLWNYFINSIWTWKIIKEG